MLFRSNEHFQLMPVVTLGSDGRSARGTWRDITLAGRKGGQAFWGEGPSENEYVKENGVWKIRSLHAFQTLYVPYDGGWQNTANANGGRFVTTGLSPDAPTSVAYGTWPKAFTPPRVAEALRALMASSVTAKRATAMAERMRSDDPVQAACTLIEEMLC